MKVVQAATRDVPIWLEYVGQTSARKSVEVRARVAGFLQKRNFEEGRLVHKGELLFVIDPRPFQEDLKQAQSGLKYNQALLEKARKDFARFKKLYDDGVVSKDEFESYQTKASTYEAQVSDNKAQVENAKIQLGYTNIYSPIDGVIGRSLVDVGNLVGQGENTLLAKITSQDPIYVTFSISENDYVRAVRHDVNGEGKYKVRLVLADDQEYDHDGRIDMAEPTIDSRTGTLGVRVIFPNPDGSLRPGQYAKVRVLFHEAKDAVVVPAKGLVDTQGIKSLYVVGADGSVENRPVTPGVESGDLLVIDKGLKAGEMVIVDGIRRVRPGMKVKPIVVPMDDQDKNVPGAQTAGDAESEAAPAQAASPSTAKGAE